MDERADEQSSGGQKHYRQRNFPGDQSLAEANAAGTYALNG